MPWWESVIMTLFLSCFLVFAPFNRRGERKAAALFLLYLLIFAVQLHIPWFPGAALLPASGKPREFLFLFSLIFGGGMIVAGWAAIIDQEEERLVSNGIYRVVRHPQYSGYLLIAIGMFLKVPGVLSLFLLSLMVIGRYRQARNEEQVLALQFPEVWPVYRQQTGMFFPRLGQCPGRAADD